MSSLLLLLSGLCHQIEGVAVKKHNKKYDYGNIIFTALFSLFAMLYFVISHKGAYNFSWQIVPYAIAAAIFYSGGCLSGFVAYGCGSYVLSKLILSYSVVVSICYGLIFLKEPISIFAYIGLLIMAVSIYLSNAKAEGGVEVSVKWLILILLSTLFSGMFGVMQRMQQIKFNDSITNEFMILTLAFSFVILMTTGLTKEGKNLRRIIKCGTPYAAIAGLSNGLTNFIMLYVYTLIPLSIAAPSHAGIEMIISFIISILMFKEKFVKRQLISVLLGIVAVVLLNI